MADVGTNPEGEAWLEARGLTKVFASETGEIRVLSDLDLFLAKGDRMAVVGASGIGKSTLLHVLGALDRPDAGSLWIRNREVFKLPEDHRAGWRNKTVGFVFQFHHLLPEFSALENVCIPRLISGESKSGAREKAALVLERVGLANRLQHRVGELSGGEQQRVAVARALVMEPAVLLADEPTGNLDAKTGAKVHELLVSLNEERGTTMVVVTHNAELAGMMNRRATLEEGKIRELS